MIPATFVHRCRVLALLAAALLAVPACELGGPRTSDRNVNLIDPQAFDELLNDDETTLILDPRPADRFAAGHLPGAINIPINRLRADLPQLAEAQQIVVYADGPDDFLSTAAAKKLIALGYANVYDFRGGIELWQAQGRRIVTAETPE